MSENRSSLLEAVNALVAVPSGAETYEAIQSMVDIAGRLGARFVGEREVYNPLVELALSDIEKYRRVIALVEEKRAVAGLEPLMPAEDGGYDKTEYMRDFMAQKRERERRAAEIENLMRPESSQLRGRSRTEFMQMQSARWKEQRDKLLDAMRQSHGRTLRREEMRAALAQFWARVDKELDGLEELARAERTGRLRRG